VPRPFLKWVGGKTQLLAALERLVPGGFRRYFEPFVGGGALFFHTRPDQAVLTDLNDELVDCYRAVRDQLDDVMAALRRHQYEKNYFYSVRSLDRKSLPLPERAARTIFLNRTGFNGLYRVNSKGIFNVPFGRHKNPLICDEHNLPACSALLRRATIQVASFHEAMAQAGKGDFVYLDPPYVPLSSTSNFTSYVAGGFGPEQQARLAEELVGLNERGARFVLSNADTPETRQMYGDLDIPGLQIDAVMASRAVNSRPDARGKVSELLVYN
jgi:DNA adenine methylase